MSTFAEIHQANAAKTRCPQGHRYDAANTYTDTRGCRRCRRCNRDRQRRRYERLAAERRARWLTPAPCCPHCGEPLPAASTDGKPGRLCPACGEPIQETAA
ncbi:MAG: hypothetical protein ACRD0W_24860 [Acidimicrobiales bacterium]